MVYLAKVIAALLVVTSISVGLNSPAQTAEANQSVATAAMWGGSGYEDGSFFGAIDSAGNLVVCGTTFSNDFQTTVGALDTVKGGESDAFITKFSPTGQVLWSTFLGGSGRDVCNFVGITADGAVAVSGQTFSTDFPTTPGVAQPTYPGGQPVIFVAMLNAAGDGLEYSTFLGGSAFDFVFSIAVSPDGIVYVAGEAHSPDFPITPGAHQSSFGGGEMDAFLTSIDRQGHILYSTFLGGAGDESISGLALNAAGNIVGFGSTNSANIPSVTSPQFGDFDLFLVEMSPEGALVRTGRFGGTGTDGALKLGISGSSYVIGGYTTSTDLLAGIPGFDSTYGGSTDGFVLKVNNDFTTVQAGTYIGGSGFENQHHLTVASDGSIYATGTTDTPNLAVTADAFQPLLAGGFDGYVTILSSDLASVEFLSYLGGTGPDYMRWIGLAPNAEAVVLGYTNSPTLLGSPSHGGGDLAIARIRLGSALPAAPCGPGSFSTSGAEPCTPAPAGSYAGGDGNTSVTLCPPGTFSSATGGASCTQAPAGSYASGDGNTSATLCLAGTFSSATGSASCTSAPAGSYAAGDGNTSATLCPPGTFSSAAGSASCTEAPAGSYASGDGNTSATLCPPGTFSSATGSASCTPAPAGSYASGRGNTSATPCPVGTTSSGGASFCTDNVPPTAAPTQSPGANAAGWNNADVTVNWNWSDSGGSGIDPANCMISSTSSGEGRLTLSATCKDLAGNTGSSSYPVKVDKTPPTLSPSVSPNPLYLNASGASASPNANDGSGAGIASSSCGAVDTSTAGDHTVSCTATDNAGNSNSATIHYTVQYQVLGFFSPLPGSKWKVGQTVPIKFMLADANGVRISDAQAAALLAPTCRVKFSASGVQTQAPTCVKYDTAMHQFVYSWKLGNASGAETIMVTVSYPGTATTTIKSEPITITQ